MTDLERLRKRLEDTRAGYIISRRLLIETLEEAVEIIREKKNKGENDIEMSRRALNMVERINGMKLDIEAFDKAIQDVQEQIIEEIGDSGKST